MASAGSTMPPSTGASMKPSTIAWILAPLSVVALFVALHVTRAAEARGPDDIFYDDFEFQFVRERVADTYVDEISKDQSEGAFNAAIDGYLKSLPDEYNDFIPTGEYHKWLDDTAGHYAGVGVKIKAIDKEGLEIIGVFPGGPAWQAGVRIGDVITHVDGVALAGLDLSKDQNLRRLKGPVGSRVQILVKTPPRKDAPPGTLAIVHPADITRDTIRPPSVFSRRLGGDGKDSKDGKIGYIRIEEFVDATVADFDAALDMLVGAGANGGTGINDPNGVKSVILDLRGNGGGVLPSTVHVADRFVREGDIVRMRGRAKGANRVEPAHDAGTISDSIGLVVLVDSHSASASEVLAGCLQDHRRGVLLGTRTFGKFLVQNITQIPGRDAAVKITTARYMTPNGRSYARDPKHPETPAGLLPDFPVELSAADRDKLEKSFANAEEAVWGAPARFPEVPADWVDSQMQRALDLIAGNLLLQEIRGKDPKNG
jgi:carboxyl-terminal processing protease